LLTSRRDASKGGARSGGACRSTKIAQPKAPMPRAHTKTKCVQARQNNAPIRELRRRERERHVQKWRPGSGCVERKSKGCFFASQCPVSRAQPFSQQYQPLPLSALDALARARAQDGATTRRHAGDMRPVRARRAQSPRRTAAPAAAGRLPRAPRQRRAPWGGPYAGRSGY